MGVSLHQPVVGSDQVVHDVLGIVQGTPGAAGGIGAGAHTGQGARRALSGTQIQPQGQVSHFPLI